MLQIWHTDDRWQPWNYYISLIFFYLETVSWRISSIRCKDTCVRHPGWFENNCQTKMKQVELLPHTIDRWDTQTANFHLAKSSYWENKRHIWVWLDLQLRSKSCAEYRLFIYWTWLLLLMHKGESEGMATFIMECSSKCLDALISIAWLLKRLLSWFIGC